MPNFLVKMETESKSLVPIYTALSEYLKGMKLAPGWYRFSIYVEPHGDGFRFDGPRLVFLQPKELE